MNKDPNVEKQIEEIVRDVDKAIRANFAWDVLNGGYVVSSADNIAQELYYAGYRKASEVAREIFEEIDKRLDAITIVMGRLDSLRTFHKTMEKVTAEVDELKKKYIGKDTNVTTNTEDVE